MYFRLFVNCVLSTGAPIAEAVIRAVCTDLASCPSVAALSNYLRKKFLLNLADYQTLSKEDAVQLNIILSKASGERMGRGRFLVRDLILSLFDLGLEQFDMWCHSMAFVLREKGKGTCLYAYAMYMHRMEVH